MPQILMRVRKRRVIGRSGIMGEKRRQLPAGVIAYRREIETRRRERRRRTRAVARLEHFAHPRGGCRPLPTYTRQPTMLRTMWCRNADRRELEDHVGSRGAHGDRARMVLTGRFAWHSRRTECAEVVLARRGTAPPRASRRHPADRDANPRGPQAPPAAPDGCRAGRRSCAQWRKSARETRARRASPTVRPPHRGSDALTPRTQARVRALDVGLEMHHLRERMHAGVGAPARR